MLHQQFCVAVQRGAAPARMPEQGVAAFECLAVCLQCLAIERMPLAAEEIEVLAAFFCSAVYQADVAIRQPGNGVGIDQVITCIGRMVARK